MSDEGFDMCEYMWDPDVVMRRLLSILRQRQAYCTDNECLNDGALPGPGTPPAYSDFFLLFIAFAFMALMLAFRPRSLRGGHGSNDTKRRDHDAKWVLVEIRQCRHQQLIESKQIKSNTIEDIFIYLNPAAVENFK
ncbi:small integral membrane protein 14 isoform X1 [Diprion similis]|uniref:small integral membrane protein 14 isoform X1 n=1 Tax=Diprion similis TaxID=362088 RepID=UPI001EF9B4D9|nr:small integral membrane protein 14 isoform X1 [Diprion similis]XP_046737592.1 small integral membrane protein 14 isoform X1 [Diprion similis]XP_046737594.1 small integral membrane protein 14 isoform X1 [Diprion similis]